MSWRKSLKVLVVVLVALLAVTALLGMTPSGAWFTDQHSVGGNRVTAGNLTVAYSETPLVAENLEPGGDAVFAGYMWVRNDGSLPAKWHSWITVDGESAELTDYLRVRVIINPTELDPNSHNYGPTGVNLFDPNNPEAEVDFNELTNQFNTYLDCIPPDADVFMPGHQIYYGVWIRLRGTAPNSAQGAILSATTRVGATNINNPGWNE